MSETKLATKADLKEMYDRMLPYLGGMPEMLANKFSKGDLYSTDEKMIGQWIDGKPIYQKTINFGALPNFDGKSVVIDSNLSIDKVVSMSGQAFSSVSDESIPIPFAHPHNLTYAIMCRVQDLKTTSPYIYIYTKIDYSTYNAYITVTYTKTTDSAISIGSDTDYSTTEKIVGTWIDGKPLYQKTFSATKVKDVNLSISLSSLSIDKMVSIEGLLYGANNTIINIYPIQRYNARDNTQASSIYYSTNNQTLNVFSESSPYSNGDIYVTVKYTKTTD